RWRRAGTTWAWPWGQCAGGNPPKVRLFPLLLNARGEIPLRISELRPASDLRRALLVLERRGLRFLGRRRRLRVRRHRVGRPAAEGHPALRAIRGRTLGLHGVGVQALGLVAREHFELVLHAQLVALVEADLVLHRYLDLAALDAA